MADAVDLWPHGGAQQMTRKAVAFVPQQVPDLHTSRGLTTVGFNGSMR